MRNQCLVHRIKNNSDGYLHTESDYRTLLGRKKSTHQRFEIPQVFLKTWQERELAVNIKFPEIQGFRTCKIIEGLDQGEPIQNPTEDYTDEHHAQTESEGT
jgi:hypothetical protein